MKPVCRKIRQHMSINSKQFCHCSRRREETDSSGLPTSVRTPMRRLMYAPSQPALFFIAAIFFLSSPLIVLSQNPSSPSAPTSDIAKRIQKEAPRIEFDSMILDFGKVEAGQVIQHDFIFTNTGNQTLEIRDVRPTCGCTIAGQWDKEVQPGKFGRIPVKFNSADYSSSILKTVIVLSNDPVNTNVVLQLKGMVWKPFEVAPVGLIFASSLDSLTNQTRTVRITNNLDESLSLSEPTCDDRAFRAALKTVRPGKEFELQVTFTPPFSTTNLISVITLRTSSTNAPLITIQALAVVQPAVLVIPARLMLPASLLASTKPFKLTVRNNGTNSLVLSEPSINAEGADIRVLETLPGRTFDLEVSFPPGFKIQPGRDIQLTVKTSHPEFPILKVPVLQGQHLATMLKEESKLGGGTHP